MAYSILKKTTNKSLGNQYIMHFLADSADDFAFIIDNCAPGSTINIVDGTRHKKKPDGTYIRIAGTGDKLPKNNAEVVVPKPNASYGGKPASDYQSNIKINKSGLVTGTLHPITDNTLYGGDSKSGHFLVVDIPTPAGADTLDTSTREGITPDGFLMIRIENLRDEKKKDKITFKKEGEEISSFTFDLSQLDLE